MVTVAKTRQEIEIKRADARTARMTAHLFTLFGARDEFRDPRRFMPNYEPTTNTPERKPTNGMTFFQLAASVNLWNKQQKETKGGKK